MPCIMPGRMAKAVLLALLTAVAASPSCRTERVVRTGMTRHNLGDGRYIIEVEAAAGNSSVEFRSHSEGTTVTEESYRLLYGERTLEIHNGALSLNGRAYGTLQPGDTIRVLADGRVLVNGSARKPE